MGDEHRDFGAVFRGEELLLGHIFVGVELDFGLFVQGRFVIGNIITVNRRRGDVRGDGIERLCVVGLTAETADGAEKVVVEVSDELAALIEKRAQREAQAGEETEAAL